MFRRERNRSYRSHQARRSATTTRNLSSTKCKNLPRSHPMHSPLLANSPPYLQNLNEHWSLDQKMRHHSPLLANSPLRHHFPLVGQQPTLQHDEIVHHHKLKTINSSSTTKQSMSMKKSPNDLIERAMYPSNHTNCITRLLLTPTIQCLAP